METVGIDWPSILFYFLNIAAWIVLIAILIRIIKNWGSTKKRLDLLESKVKKLETKS